MEDDLLSGSMGRDEEKTRSVSRWYGQVPSITGDSEAEKNQAL
jgi:hypothetical protein